MAIYTSWHREASKEFNIDYSEVTEEMKDYCKRLQYAKRLGTPTTALENKFQMEKVGILLDYRAVKELGIVNIQPINWDVGMYAWHKESLYIYDGTRFNLIGMTNEPDYIDTDNIHFRTMIPSVLQENDEIQIYQHHYIVDRIDRDGDYYMVTLMENKAIVQPQRGFGQRRLLYKIASELIK